MAKNVAICRVCGWVIPSRSNRCWSCGARMPGGKIAARCLKVLLTLVGCGLFFFLSALTNGI